MESERNPMSLSNEDLMAVMQQWRKLHPVDSEGKNSSSPREPLEKIYREQGAVYPEVIAELRKLLSADALAELHAIFSIGRDHEVPPEQLDKIAAGYRSDLVGVVNLDHEIAQLLGKANFRTCVSAGLVMLGRSEMASSLNEI
ncbi:hypothetical protein [Tardiphaga sp. 862_B3_N1_1]|uniref:hypothetical protein n=1 Tax=Tardiphaga sp. 862_B3_N1_1 TaxID=3240763 RepID=UPI003F8959B5